MARKKQPTAAEMGPEIVRLARVLVEKQGVKNPMGFTIASADGVHVSVTYERYPSVPKEVKRPCSITITTSVNNIGRIVVATVGWDDNRHVIGSAKLCRRVLESLRRASPLEGLVIA